MAFDCFLKIEGIPGESTDDKHKDWIEILAFSHGLSQPGGGARSSGGAASGERCDHMDFSITKTLDKASPKLSLHCCNGQHISKIRMELCRAAGDKQKYMEYLMSDVIISSVRPNGSAQGSEALPTEEVGLSYGKIEWQYTETDHKTGKPKGQIAATWDVVSNSGG